MARNHQGMLNRNGFPPSCESQESRRICQGNINLCCPVFSVIPLAVWPLLVTRLNGSLMWTSQVILMSPSQDVSFRFSAGSYSLFHSRAALQIVFLQSSWSADLRTYSWVRKKKPTVNTTKPWSFQCSQLRLKEAQRNTWMPNKMGWNTNYGKTLQKRLSAPVRVQASKLVSCGTKVSCQIWIISLHVDKSSHFYIPPLPSFSPLSSVLQTRKETLGAISLDNHANETGDLNVLARRSETQLETAVRGIGMIIRE